MRGTIKIGANDVEMLANAASPIIFRQVFHEDFLHEMQGITEKTGEKAVDLFSKMGFVMAMQVARPIAQLSTLCYGDFLTWLSEFEPYDLMNAIAGIATLYNNQELTTSTAKKEEG